MANDESTAVNALIELTRQKSVDDTVVDDLLFDKRPRTVPRRASVETLTAPVLPSSVASAAPLAPSTAPVHLSGRSSSQRMSAPAIPVPIQAGGMPEPLPRHRTPAATGNAFARAELDELADDQGTFDALATANYVPSTAPFTAPFTPTTAPFTPTTAPFTPTTAPFERSAPLPFRSTGGVPEAVASPTTMPVQLIDGADWFVSSQPIPRYAEEELRTQSMGRVRPLGPIIAAAATLGALVVLVAGFIYLDGAGGKTRPLLQGVALGSDPSAETSPVANAIEEAALGRAPKGPPIVLSAGDDFTGAGAGAAAATPPLAPTEAATADLPSTTVAPIAAAPTAPAAAAPAVVAAVVPAAVAAPGALTDITFKSTPSGASVVLVDGGRTLPIGSTPVTASIDVGRRYDVVFALHGHPTRIESLTPGGATTLIVDLDGVAKAAPVAPASVAPSAAAAAPPAASVSAAPPAPPVVEAEPASTRPPPRVKSPSKSRDVAIGPTGEGTLMISSKPPCVIVIDGRNTGLTTPQRAIKVKAGSHRITLTNEDAHIKKTFIVKVAPGKATKVIKDYSDLIKK